VKIPTVTATAVADERTLAILDFPAVLERLAERCASPLGRERALALRPLGRRRAVEAEQRETAEARRLLQAGQALPLEGLHDVRDLVERAARGAVLGARELWRIGETAGCLGRLRAFCRARAEQAPALADWAEAIADLDEVHAEVTRCLHPDGEVLDAASPELAEARRLARRLEAALREKLEELLRTPQVQEALQEPLVTLRQDRFVLPVRADARAAVPGLVHDQSASGATLFVEPLAVVDLGNRLRAAQAAAAHEEARVLGRLSGLCGRDRDGWLRSLDAAGHLDFCLAKARLAEAWGAVPPELLEEPALDLRGARHPLLERPVPVDLQVGLGFDALVLTGPNTGGKTVSLKIAGLFACMAQAGLHLPAAEARVGVFPRICGDAGDEQGVAQNLSTFSSHMRAVVAALRAVVPGALVLLDELGAGTDPGEGAALAMAILEHLLAAGARVLVTTHYSELKAFAQRTPRVANAAVTFDPETLAPTYRLVLGVPGPSHALAIAERLGLPPAVVERARALQRPEERQVERMIADMAAEERRLREAAERAEAQAAEAEAVRRQLEEERAALEARRAEWLESARRQAEQLLAEARREAEAALRELRRMLDQARRLEKEAAARAGGEAAEAASLTAVVEAARARRDALRRLHASVVQPPAGARGSWHPGQPVRIRSLAREGVLLALPQEGKDGALVQLGTLRLHVPLDDLAPAAPTGEGSRGPLGSAPGPAAALLPAGRAVPTECDVRGCDRLEALARVDKALDDAVLAGLRQIRLIHGKGTGALREAIREFLRGHPQVESFRLADAGEGGAGATVVVLRA
jgi:DNA mismatch repair protein MutS2